MPWAALFFQWPTKTSPLAWTNFPGPVTNAWKVPSAEWSASRASNFHIYIIYIYNRILYIYIYIPKVKGALKEFSTQPLFFLTLPLNTVPSARFLAQKPVNRAPSFHTLPFSSGSLWYIMCRKSNATESYTNDWLSDLSVLTWQTWNHQSSVYDAQLVSQHSETLSPSPGCQSHDVPEQWQVASRGEEMWRV